MPKPSNCIDCMQDGPVADPQPVKQTAEHAIIAKFTGRCSPKFGCGDPIEEGEWIVKLMPADVWIHWECDSV